jgi:hypothetical protein
MIVPRARKLMPMLKYVGLPLLLLVLYDLAVVAAYKLLRWDWVAISRWRCSVRRLESLLRFEISRLMGGGGRLGFCGVRL